MSFNPALPVVAILGAILMIVFLRKSSLRWRCAALAGIAAIWLWGMALTLSSFLSYCLLVRMKGTGDSAAIAHAVGDFLISAAATQGMTRPLLIAIAVIFFIHKPQTSGRDA